MISDIEIENIVESSNSNVFIYTIFKRPFDYPFDIVSRVFKIEGSQIIATNKIKKFKDLKECFSYFEGHGLTFLYADKKDHFNIVGSFI